MIHGTPGTVSHATLRSEDLLNAFSSTLEDLVTRNPELPLSRRKKWTDLVWLAREVKDYDSDTAVELVADLMDALEEFAPPGHSFGAHEGDGSDFGWWPVEND